MIHAPGNCYDRMHRSAQGGQISFSLYHHPQQEVKDRKIGNQEVHSVPSASHAPSGNQIARMARRTNPAKPAGRTGATGTMEKRTPRPKPKIDFTIDALDFKNVNLLRQ